MLAAGALLAVRERGLRIPDDVSLASFFESDHIRYVTPAITCLTDVGEGIARARSSTALDHRDAGPHRRAAGRRRCDRRPDRRRPRQPVRPTKPGWFSAPTATIASGSGSRAGALGATAGRLHERRVVEAAGLRDVGDRSSSRTLAAWPEAAHRRAAGGQRGAGTAAADARRRLSHADT